MHQACLDACQPGATLRQLHHMSVRLLAEALAQLGVAPGQTARDLLQGSYRRFYPHSGGWCGLPGGAGGAGGVTCACGLLACALGSVLAHPASAHSLQLALLSLLLQGGTGWALALIMTCSTAAPDPCHLVMLPHVPLQWGTGWGWTRTTPLL